MKKLLFLPLLLVFLLPVKGQKTIFEILDLPKAGCSLASPQAWEEQEEEWLIEEVPDESIFAEEETRRLPAGYSNFGQLKPLVSEWIAKATQADETFLEGRIDWRDDLEFFLCDGKWGLRNTSGKIKIKPQFDFVLADTSWQGFVAYQGGTCNYYSTKGKARLPEEYLVIRPFLNVFVVKTNIGFGLLDEKGKTILPPEQLSIYPLDKDRPYLSVRYAEDKAYWFRIGDGQRTYYQYNYYPFDFIGDHHLLVYKNSLIDLRNNREVFCGKQVVIKLVDQAQGYLTISDAATPEQKYLINLKGELISQETFAHVDAYLPTGHFVVRKKISASADSPLYAGLIDAEGRWTILPRYKTIGKQLHADQYLEVTLMTDETRLVTLDNKSMTPFKPYFHIEEEPDGKNLKLVWKEGGETRAALLNLETTEFTELDAPGYWKRYAISTCEDVLAYRAVGVEGQMLIDATGNPLLTEPAGYIMKSNIPGGITIMRKRMVDGRRINVTEMVDCTGQPFENITPDNQRYQLDDDFFYVKKASGESFFQLPDGTEVTSTSNWKGPSGKLSDDYFLLRDHTDFMGVINRRGEVVLPPALDHVFLNRTQGMLYVSALEEGTYFRADGREFPGEAYTEVEHAGLHLFRVQQYDRWGIMDRTGKMILPAAYTRIYVSNGMITAFSYGNEKTVFDLAGRELK